METTNRIREPRRLLIIRLGYMGDVALATALLPALRSLWPETEIDWLVEPLSAPLLKRHPHIRRVLVWNRSGEVPIGDAADAVSNRAGELIPVIQDADYDLVVEAQGDWIGAAWAVLSGARDRLGLGTRGLVRRLMTQVVDPNREHGGRIAETYWFLAKALGFEGDPPGMSLTLQWNERVWAAEWLGEHGIDHDPIIVSPFARFPERNWEVDNWLELIRWLRRTTRRCVLVLGGESHQKQADAWRAELDDEGVVARCDRETNLRDLMALISRAGLMIGVDCGITHIALAFERRTIALFGGTCPYLELGPHRERVRIHFHPFERRAEGEADKPIGSMQMITVEEVMASVSELLADDMDSSTVPLKVIRER